MQLHLLLWKKKPNAQELIDKLTPYQGWIGVVLTIWGVLGLISSISNFSILGLGIGVVEFIVGFLLAYGLISKYLLEKMRQQNKKDKS